MIIFGLSILLLVITFKSGHRLGLGQGYKMAAKRYGDHMHKILTTKKQE